MTKLVPFRTWRACPLALLFVFGCGESADSNGTAETADDAASSAGSASTQNIGNAGAGSGEGAGLVTGAGNASDSTSAASSPGGGGGSEADLAAPSGPGEGSSGPPGTEDGQAAVPPGAGAATTTAPVTSTDDSTADDSTAGDVVGADEPLTEGQLADDESSDDDATDTLGDDPSDMGNELGGDDFSGDDSSDMGDDDSSDDDSSDDMSAASDDSSSDDMSAASDDSTGDDDVSDDLSETDDSESDEDTGNDSTNEGAACTGVSGDFGVVGSTIIVQAGQTYDGQCQRFVAGPGLGDGSQSESQDPVFRLEQGARLLNVVLGSPAADGIHVYGDARLSNIVWEDVGEDALTIKESGEVILDGGSARDGEDKIFQINAAATFRVSNFTATNGGKFIRQNGGTTYQVDVFVDGCDISNMNESIFRTDSNSSSLTLSNTRYSDIGEVFRRGDDRGASYNDAGGNSSY